MLDQFNGFNQVVGISLISLSVTTILVTSNHQNFTRAQENPGCFIVDHAERVVNLDGICIPQVKAELEPPAIIKGIALTGTRIIRERSEVPLITGTITNTTNQTIQVNSIKLQFQDKSTGVVITTETLDVEAYLAPKQSREFRKPVFKDSDLGGRRESNIKMPPDFIDWI
ncbi:hypothetical protein PCC9214_04188 [Planktothrix tepida]|uniref:Uncharacterized protein n=1 Tax=Planktothrix tepida PCC 9214 TaxID=671072 RepID=A0A1J1LC57_9CYAN|nr:FxLYD domain-containing protein [Planktothrix tepida]CAD5976291.1 hypothetical protein PCC9214_04188 [Planktothrix tepida]CUR30283.1 hypothetical protein PL9214120002 [Planktothrix tepida PCC 9214]